MEQLRERKVLEDVLEVLANKAEDYNGGIVKREDYFPFGVLSYAQMIHTKSLRIISVAEQSLQSKVPNNESLADSLIDIINYAIFMKLYLDTKEREKQTAFTFKEAEATFLGNSSNSKNNV